jgi:hypothetical protein
MFSGIYGVQAEDLPWKGKTYDMFLTIFINIIGLDGSGSDGIKGIERCARSEQIFAPLQGLTAFYDPIYLVHFLMGERIWYAQGVEPALLTGNDKFIGFFHGSG